MRRLPILDLVGLPRLSLSISSLFTFGSWFDSASLRPSGQDFVLGCMFASAHSALWFLVLGSWFLVLGSWFLVLGSWFLVLGSWFLVLGSWFLVLGSWFEEKLCEV
jgi:hypothetical protein